jgi:exosortase
LFAQEGVMSESVESSMGHGLISPEAVVPVVARQDTPVFDLRELAKHPAFIPTVVMVASLCLAFTSLWKAAYDDWVAPDSLYSHGPLIPFLAAYILWIRWPRIKDTPVKGSVWALLALVPIMYVTWIAARTGMKQTQSILFVMAGKRWALAVLPVVAFLLFGLPVWTELIDHYTLAMQHLSTDMAVGLLQLCGLHPIRTDPTTVYLDHFVLNVAAACSGAKLTLAITAFSAFFMLTRQARPLANVILVVILIPFCLFVNGIRIAMVGIVGNMFGNEAGRSFHDWGGYIALVICFALLSTITKALGYKQ